MKDKALTIPLYDASVRVVVCKTEEEFEQAVFDAHYQEDISGMSAIMLHYPDNPLQYFIGFVRGKTSPGIISHEALHLTNRILKDVGIEYDCENDEAMCYLHGFIVDCLHKIIKK